MFCLLLCSFAFPNLERSPTSDFALFELLVTALLTFKPECLAGPVEIPEGCQRARNGCELFLCPSNADTRCFFVDATRRLTSLPLGLLCTVSPCPSVHASALGLRCGIKGGDIGTGKVAACTEVIYPSLSSSCSYISFCLEAASQSRRPSCSWKTRPRSSSCARKNCSHSCRGCPYWRGGTVVV